MNIRDRVASLTILQQCQTPSQVIWETIEKPIKSNNSPRGKGEMPYQFGQSYYSVSNSSQRTHLNKKSTKKRKTNFHRNNSTRHVNKFSFVNGGVYSNEAFERCYRKSQQKYKEENIKHNISNVCSNATSSTESYKTAMQKSCDSTMANDKLVISETLLKSELRRYRKNALILGLLRNKLDYSDVDGNYTVTGPFEDYQDLNQTFNSVESEISYLQINDENAMLIERISRLFQSQKNEEIKQSSTHKPKDQRS